MITLRIAANVLKAALTHSARNDVRYYLNGVHFRNHNGALVVEATDGHRALKVTLEHSYLEIPLGAPLKAIIKNSDLEHIIKGKKWDVELNFDGKTVTCGDNAYTLIDGVFPCIDSVIPKDKPKELLSGTYHWDYLVELRDAANLIFTGKTKGFEAIRVTSERPKPSQMVSGCAFYEDKQGCTTVEGCIMGMTL